MPLTTAAAGPSGHQAGPFIGGGAIYTRAKSELYSRADFPSNDDGFNDDCVSWKAPGG